MTDEEIEILRLLIQSGKNVWMKDYGGILIPIKSFQADYIGPEGGVSEPVVWTSAFGLANEVGLPCGGFCFALWNSEASQFFVLDQKPFLECAI